MSKIPEDEFKDVIAELRCGAPEPPALRWGAYRAELREKLERRGNRGWAGRRWAFRPFPIAVAASFVAVLVYFGLPGQSQLPGDPALVENAILASHLDMIGRLDVVQQLDLLEDFDVIRRLDSLPGRSEG